MYICRRMSKFTFFVINHLRLSKLAYNRQKVRICAFVSVCWRIFLTILLSITINFSGNLKNIYKNTKMKNNLIIITFKEE